MFPMKLENVIVRCQTFGGVHQRAEFKVGGKKPVKFDGRDVLYNVWCILIRKGRDVSRGDICLVGNYLNIQIIQQSFYLCIQPTNIL